VAVNDCVWYLRANTVEDREKWICALEAHRYRLDYDIVHFIGALNLEFTVSSQGFGSGSVLDPDSIRSVEPDPDSESVSESRRAKVNHKSRKN
jgi:hypothetical protein